MGCQSSKTAATASVPTTAAAASVTAPKTLLNSRTFQPADAKGGSEIKPAATAVVFIEYQNEFTTVGGKLHGAVKEVMEASDMLNKSAAVAKAVRKAGGKAFHVPISFAKDGSDNPNKNLGILSGCAKDELFTAGTWNAEFCDTMKPEAGDVVVTGKKGLDAFPGTDLEAQLKAHGIETVVLAGFLTNCCVESTMRTACEKGFNVITLTDCTAATSKEGQAAAVQGTFGMFSAPMGSADFISKLEAQPAASPIPAAPVESLQQNLRAFLAADAKGGAAIKPGKTAVLFIEYQNEFTTEGGKLHGAVKEIMDSSALLDKSAAVAKAVRSAGGKVLHAPISFAKDGSDNPNKGLGILAGCANDELFTSGTWNAEICDAMKPEEGDLVVKGKKGLDAFPGTDLEALLLANGIETIVLAGFLTNCCVESTMRTACEKGFNVVTLTDCMATTSTEGQAAATEGTFGMFSLPMSAAVFMEKLAPGAVAQDRGQAIGKEVTKEAASSMPEPNTETIALEGAVEAKSCWKCC
jgi:nicotinamidase-related amidase